MSDLRISNLRCEYLVAPLGIVSRDPDAIPPALTAPGTPGLFRREFEVPAPVLRATLYASARGVLDIRANGRAGTSDLSAPEWTDYDTRFHYRTRVRHRPDPAERLPDGRNLRRTASVHGLGRGSPGTDASPRHPRATHAPR